MNLENIHFLTSPDGKNLLTTLAEEDLSDANTLSLITRLRKSYSADEASAALTQARLRGKATDKFGDAAGLMLFTDDALQQASDPLIRAYRAGQIEADCVIDACCGIGADSLAFAQAGKSVLGIDLDPVRIEIARHNAVALGLSNAHFEVADVRDAVPSSPCETVFFDPARRDARGNRIYDVERYLPPLSLINDWRMKNVIVKLSPGVDLEQLASYGGGVEFISVNGDLKEAVLWRDANWHGTKATLLIDSEGYHWHREGSEPDVMTGEPLAWLVEPDAALIRASLVRDVAATLDGRMLDETIAYFTTDRQPDSVWVRSWKILDWMPFHLKKLRAYLRERGVGQVTVKKRGSPLTPETLIPKLKLKGDSSCTLVLTRMNTQAVVLICADYMPDTAQ